MSNHNPPKQPAHQIRAGSDDAYEQGTVQFVQQKRATMKVRTVRFEVSLNDGRIIQRAIDLPHIRLGSAKNNDLTVADPSVSRFHCELRYSDDGFVLRDLGSTNGTVVGDLSVREALLVGPTTLQLGRSTVKVSPADQEAVVPSSTDAHFGELVGRSQQMRDIFGVLKKISATDLTVSVQGETGTGKDLVARAIHQASPRAKGPFVVFDAGAVASNLIESELFGHEKGAFTGATEQRKGAFEQADGGTLFIDEIGELALELQPKLLRALEQREIRRVGGSRSIPVDVRVVCATNRELADEVQHNRFRDDLYFRISVVVLHLPPLRERREDIDLLVETFLRRGPQPMQAEPATVNVLRNHDWPGNVRELLNAIETARAMTTGQVLSPSDLVFHRDLDTSRQEGPVGGDSAAGSTVSLAGKTLESIEKEAIGQTLASLGGNRSAAARALGIAPSTLYLKMKKYEIG